MFIGGTDDIREIAADLKPAFGSPQMQVISFTKSDPALVVALARLAPNPETTGFRRLLCGVATGQIALTAILGSRVAWTPRSLKSSLPNVVVISDDAGSSRNPDEWRCSISAIAWARVAIIHGTGAQLWHYNEAIEAARRWKRCLFIETDSAHVAAWAAALEPRGIPVLCLIPPPGGESHPIPRGECAA